MILIYIKYYYVQSFEKELQGFGHHAEGKGDCK
jgi:hypothetical protein